MENELKNLLLDYPNILMGTRESFRRMIKKYYGPDVLKANIIMMVYDEKIPQWLEENKTIDKDKINAFVNNIVKEYGITQKDAADAVYAWIEAMDCNITQGALSQYTTESASQYTEDTSQYTGDTSQYTGDISQYTEFISQHGEGINQYADGVIQYTEDASQYNAMFKYYKIGRGMVIDKYIGFENDEIVIPDKIDGEPVLKINDYAFENCSFIKRIKLPNCLECIGNGAFENCTGLTSIELPESLLYIGIENSSKSSPSDRPEVGSVFTSTSIREIKIPRGIKKIYPWSFSSCTSLERVILPETVECIESFAFSYCKKLRSINIPASVKYIKFRAFEGCEQLESIVLPYGLCELENEAFEECNRLLSVYFTNNTAKIGDLAFGFFKRPKNLPKIIIYCESGSTAMTYARKNDYDCKQLPQNIKQRAIADYELVTGKPCMVPSSIEPAKATDLSIEESIHSNPSQKMERVNYSSQKPTSGWEIFLFFVGGFFETWVLSWLICETFYIDFDDFPGIILMVMFFVFSIGTGIVYYKVKD